MRYGANGVYYFKTLTNGTSCSNSVFGDPLIGVVKECVIQVQESGTFCADENQLCSFTGTKNVRYGANGVYVFKTLTDGTMCSNSVFGDPLIGVVKECYIF